ncbi:LOW QUALITY PROTEIN: glutamate receptor 3.7-like [Dioscorea cayenensis subsp. rotundata]|uniref:Glutamate receptor n=1 Tax=Dioscorea cayennensis subsp. rotundata TaxID=55577 RepID=A0AB40BXD6_DIOCR|nr:LOW QUALITY PROTEIN: glutamate receptor 3.7-like [Dioscorea cayenensis subsp. rotundata]
MGFAVVVFLISLVLSLEGLVNGARPAVVNIGAVLSYDSVIGKVSKVAIEAAVADVNSNSSFLGGTKLNLIMRNANCSALVGSVGAFQLLEKNAVAIIGPESSSIAHVVSLISNGLQIPLISFAATDPSLCSLQFNFSLRITQSDSYQMAAMADLIYYNGWKRVIAIFIDDEYGRNGLYSLEDELAKTMSKITYKIALPPGATSDFISEMLEKSKLIGTRVYVVHVNPDFGLRIFSSAEHLQMITDEYVWLATHWLSTALDSSESNLSSLSYLQGVVGFRQYIPQTDQKDAFLSRWRELKEKILLGQQLNNYAFYAYDTVWAIARALREFLDDSMDIVYSSKNINTSMKTQFKKLKTFEGGQVLLDKLILLNFTGVSGPIQFDSSHSLVSGVYEIINIVKSSIHTVGYWTNQSHLSLVLPKNLYENMQRNYSTNESLGPIVWPGGGTRKPRGWVVADNQRPLRIGIPHRHSYVDFVKVMTGSPNPTGYCIDLFEAAIKLVPYNVPYKFVPFGDGHSNPNYDKLIDMIFENVIDAAVGDIAIVANRTKVVDFTQPYISAGLVIVAPVDSIKSNVWVFLRPFSVGMWCVTGAFFLLIGLVIWILEHRVNKDFRGPPKRQLVNMLLFSFSTLFNSHQEETTSTLARMVMMIWLFLLMVITSSYTANLTSFLTVQQLSSPIKGIDSLIASNQPIGFQEGSFAQSYLRDVLNIDQSKLVSLGSPEAYEKALLLGPNDGGVAAIVDELPYVELFLSQRKGFGIIGLPFTKSGWGFAFPRDSPLAADLSIAILKLSENSELQKIHQKWFCKSSCIVHTSSSSNPDELHFTSFWGLFLLCGIAIVASLLLFLIRAICQYVRFREIRRDLPSTEEPSSSKSCSLPIRNFFDFIDEKEEAIKNMFKQQKNQAQPQPI